MASTVEVMATTSSPFSDWFHLNESFWFCKIILFLVASTWKPFYFKRLPGVLAGTLDGRLFWFTKSPKLLTTRSKAFWIACQSFQLLSKMPPPLNSSLKSSPKEQRPSSDSPGFINVVDVEEEEESSRTTVYVCSRKRIMMAKECPQMEFECYYPVKMVGDELQEVSYYPRYCSIGVSKLSKLLSKEPSLVSLDSDQGWKGILIQIH